MPITILKCLRCTSEFVPNNPNKPPHYCPVCNSPYWNKPRRVGNPIDFTLRLSPNHKEVVEAFSLAEAKVKVWVSLKD